MLRPLDGSEFRRRSARIGPLRHAVGEGRRRQRVVLTIETNLVAGLPQVAEHVRLVRLEEIIETAMSAHAGGPAGQHAAAGCGTYRELDMAVLKARSASRQPVEVRRPHDGVAVAAERVGAQLIGHEYNDVRPLAGAAG